MNPPQTTLLLGIGGLALGIAAGLAAFSSASNPLRGDAPRSRKEIAKIDAGVQRAIAHPRCPDCGNTDVTTGGHPEDLACPDKHRKEWLVEYDTDPAILYAAYVADDGSIRLERID